MGSAPHVTFNQQCKTYIYIYIVKKEKKKCFGGEGRGVTGEAIFIFFGGVGGSVLFHFF